MIEECQSDGCSKKLRKNQTCVEHLDMDLFAETHELLYSGGCCAWELRRPGREEPGLRGVRRTVLLEYKPWALSALLNVAALGYNVTERAQDNSIGSPSGLTTLCRINLILGFGGYETYVPIGTYFPIGKKRRRRLLPGLSGHTWD